MKIIGADAMAGGTAKIVVPGRYVAAGQGSSRSTLKHAAETLFPPGTAGGQPLNSKLLSLAKHMAGSAVTLY
ncbi:hypothetical protein VKY48_15210 [Endobacterium cereale]|nr:hypothetical protein [Endobacterium cereale]